MPVILAYHLIQQGIVIRGAYHVVIAAADILSRSGEASRRGGYLAVLEIERGSMEMLIRVGDVPEDKEQKCITLAMEKCRRLRGCSPDLTSYESRDPAAGQWGGAVRAEPLILGFSGLPELWDEAAMFVLAIRLGRLHENQVLAQISAERNPHLRPLLEAAHWRTE